jgi:hypothetical protein
MQWSSRLRDCGTIQTNKTKMKIPEILVNPPAWLAIPLCAFLGASYIAILIVLKNIIH